MVCFSFLFLVDIDLYFCFIFCVSHILHSCETCLSPLVYSFCHVLEVDSGYVYSSHLPVLPTRRHPEPSVLADSPSNTEYRPAQKEVGHKKVSVIFEKIKKVLTLVSP